MVSDTSKHALARREEIISACLKLYENLNFKDISIKDIAEYTSFSRPSIYNYFETKEEIFLAIFQNEYESWTEDLNKIASDNKKMSVKQFAKQLSKTLENRLVFLKLLSMNLYDMEEHSKLEKLTEFKKAFGASMVALGQAIKRAFPEYNKTNCEKFVYSFFPFMNGIYPYTFITSKQSQAIELAEIKFKPYEVYDLVYNTVIKLLS